jgi:hypothetical protein
VTRFLVFLLLVVPLAAQSVLHIRVLEGEGIVYPAGGRATRGITVQVTDETGKPVLGAAVTFRLPDSGPTGEFAEGGRTSIQITSAEGRALVWGMRWNREVGPLEVRITASKGAARAGIVNSIYLSDTVKDGPAAEGGVAPPKSRSKLWIALGAVAAAVGVVAVTANSGGGPAASTVPPGAINAPQIGSPTVTIGRP